MFDEVKSLLTRIQFSRLKPQLDYFCLLEAPIIVDPGVFEVLFDSLCLTDIVSVVSF